MSIPAILNNIDNVQRKLINIIQLNDIIPPPPPPPDDPNWKPPTTNNGPPPPLPEESSQSGEPPQSGGPPPPPPQSGGPKKPGAKNPSSGPINMGDIFSSGVTALKKTATSSSAASPTSSSTASSSQNKKTCKEIEGKQLRFNEVDKIWEKCLGIPGQEFTWKKLTQEELTEENSTKLSNVMGDPILVNKIAKFINSILPNDAETKKILEDSIKFKFIPKTYYDAFIDSIKPAVEPDKPFFGLKKGQQPTTAVKTVTPKKSGAPGKKHPPVDTGTKKKGGSLIPPKKYTLK